MAIRWIRAVGRDYRVSWHLAIGGDTLCGFKFFMYTTRSTEHAVPIEDRCARCVSSVRSLTWKVNR